MYRFLSSSCVTSIHALHTLMRCIYALSIHALYSVLFFFIYQLGSFIHALRPTSPSMYPYFCILHGPFSSPDPCPALISAQFFHPTLFPLDLCFSEIAWSFPKFWALLTPLCSDIRVGYASAGKLQSYRQILASGLAKRAWLWAKYGRSKYGGQDCGGNKMAE